MRRLRAALRLRSRADARTTRFLVPRFTRLRVDVFRTGLAAGARRTARFVDARRTPFSVDVRRALCRLVDAVAAVKSEITIKITKHVRLEPTDTSAELLMQVRRGL